MFDELKQILLRRNRKYMLNSYDSTDNAFISETKLKQLAIIIKELGDLGFVLAPELSNELLNNHEEIIKHVGEQLILFARKDKGHSDNMTPLFDNFANVSLEDCYEDMLNNIPTQCEIIGLCSPDDLINETINILNSKVSYSQQDKEDVETIIKTYINTNVLDYIMPNEIPIKENLVFIINTIINLSDNAEKLILDKYSKYFKTYTDVLRLAVAMSNQDISLSSCIRFKKFKRWERRMLLGLFDTLGNNNHDDLIRHRELFLRLGEHIHPGDYSKKYKHAYKNFDDLRNNYKTLKKRTFNSRKEQAFKDKDLDTILSLLTKRPGEFARSLNRILLLAQELGYDSDVVMKKFKESAYNKVPISTLMTVLNYLENRSSNNELRVFYPKGQLGKAFSINNNLTPMNTEYLLNASETLYDLIVDMLRNKDELGKVYIDNKLNNYVAPFKLRDLSKASKQIERGSRFDIEDNNIRFYLHWVNEIDENGWESRTDLDLSLCILNDELTTIDTLYYDNLSVQGCTHSGDITDAPVSEGGGTEYADIHIDKLHKDARYIAILVHSYTMANFCELPEAFVGYMSIPNNTQVKDYDASLSKLKLDLTSKSKATMPCILDIKSMKIIWTDLNIDNNNEEDMIYNNAVYTKSAMKSAMYNVIHTFKTTLYDLILINASTRGEIVNNIKDADIIFVEDNSKVPSNDILRTRTIVNINEEGEEEEDIETYNAKVITAFDTSYIVSELI
jgi:stress response protein SCP2